MKKQLIPALFLFTLLVACEEIEPSIDHSTQAAAQPAISAVVPESAECGAELTLYGDNFGTTVPDNFVTFDFSNSDPHSGRIAEVTKVLNAGEITVRVPTGMAPGYYTISLHANGKTKSAETAIRIRE
ncbi:MAG TPA: IPT/TIG domain-containing protein [Cyclobacteriaceae bacterium]|nr:IPT/TIG domain-containing protein [Cyclobacteriaceae bacterium]